MGSNKKRLYVALYPTGRQFPGPQIQRYHWALLTGPKKEGEEGKDKPTPGHRYHVRNNPITKRWEYEELELGNVRNTANLIARVVIGKVEDEAKVIEILRGVPVVNSDPHWYCLTWVKHAIEALRRDGKAIGTGVLDWDEIEKTSREFAGGKLVSGRFQTEPGAVQPAAKPLWSMIENRELVP